jgi:hypothetical protein
MVSLLLELALPLGHWHDNTGGVVQAGRGPREV